MIHASVGWPIFISSASYLIFDSILDAYIFRTTDFFTLLLTPDPMCLIMRLLNLLLITVYAVHHSMDTHQAQAGGEGSPVKPYQVGEKPEGGDRCHFGGDRDERPISHRPSTAGKETGSRRLCFHVKSLRVIFPEA